MWLVVSVWLVTFGFMGAALARTRGYNAAFGAVVGLTGFGALLMLAYLPDRSSPALSGVRAGQESPVMSERAEQWLLGSWLFVVGGLTLGLMLAALSTRWPVLSRALVDTQVSQVVGPLVGVAIGLAMALVYGLAFYTLVRDRRIPDRARAPWVIALVFLNLLAGLAFVPWRWAVLRRSQAH